MADMSVIKRVASLPGGVVVLCGGPGGEREVSLDSGRSVHEALVRGGLENRLIVLPEERPDKVLADVSCSLAVMMLHGEFGEDGEAQALFESRDIPFTGSGSSSCRLSMDKNATKIKIRDLGVPTPRWVVGKSVGETVAAAKAASLTYPLFVKPNFRGSSVGVSRVDDEKKLAGAVEAALSVDCVAMVEEMVVGREMTVGWLNGRILPVVEMRADGVFYDYQAKYHSDATRYECPAALDESLAGMIASHAATVAEAVGARDLARVDVLLGENGPMVLELNALPGFTGHSLFPMAAKVAGIGIEELCLTLVEFAAKRFGDGSL